MIDEHTIVSLSRGYTRKIWHLAPAAARPAKIGLFLDGEFYVDQMNAPAVIRELEAQGAIPPMACVFVSSVDGAARHEDLTCNSRYTGFLMEDVLPWIRARHPHLAAGGHLIGGVSLSALAAAFAALQHPEVFSQCVGHSGSFWWRREWLTGRLPETRPARGKWWLSVGDKETVAGVSHPPTGMLQEIAQLPACERFAQALRERNHEVSYRVYEGGHEFGPWTAEFPDALRWVAN